MLKLEGQNINAVVNELLKIFEGTLQSMTRDGQWSHIASAYHLFIAQFCTGYTHDYKPRFGDCPTCLDFTLLRRLGLSSENEDILQLLAVSQTAGGVSTTRITRLRKDGGMPFSLVTHYLVMRFPQLVIGQQQDEPHVFKEDRANYMLGSKAWRPLVDAYERVFLSAFSIGYLTEGLLPATAYTDVFTKNAHLPISDYEQLRVMAGKTKGCEIYAQMTAHDLKEGMKLQTGNAKSFKSHWLDRLKKQVLENVIKQVNSAISGNQADQLAEWASLRNDRLFLENVESEMQEYPDVANYRQLSCAIQGATPRQSDSILHLQAATFITDFFHLQEDALIPGRVVSQYRTQAGQIVHGSASNERAIDLVDSIAERLYDSVFKPMLDKTAALFPQEKETPRAYVPLDDRSQELTPYHIAGTSASGTGRSTRILDTGIIGLVRKTNIDYAGFVTADLPPLNDSQDPNHFKTAAKTVVDLHRALDPLIEQWKADLDRVAQPVVSQKISKLYDMFQRHNNKWAKTVANERVDKHCDIGVSAILDMRTLVRRILSHLADESVIEMAYVEDTCRLYDQILCISVHLLNPGLWSLALEILLQKLPSYPRRMAAKVRIAHAELFLAMRHGLTTAFSLSDGQRVGLNWTTEEMIGRHKDSILRSISFMVSAQRNLCACKHCRRLLYAHEDTLPAHQILGPRQLTTSSVYTRMGLRDIVIKGACGVPPAIIRSSRGPCPSTYWPEFLSLATLAALKRIAKLEHRFCKYVRDRPSQALMLATQQAQEGFDEED